MDPEAALNMAMSAVADGEWSDAREYLSNYKAWRRGGGFQPAGGDARAKRIAAAIRAKSAAKLAPNKRKARLRRNADANESGVPSWMMWGGLLVGGYLAYRWWFAKPAAQPTALSPQPGSKAPPMAFQSAVSTPKPAPAAQMPSLVSPPLPAPRLPSNSQPDDDVKYDVEVNDYVEEPAKGPGMGNYYGGA